MGMLGFVLLAVLGGAIVRIVIVFASHKNYHEMVVRDLQLNAQQATTLALCSQFYESRLREHVPNGRVGIDGMMRMGRAICLMPPSFAKEVADGMVSPVDALDALTDVLTNGEHSSSLVAEFVRLGTGALVKLSLNPRDERLREEIRALLRYAESNNAMQSAAVALRLQFEEIVGTNS
jgi:hypothetical protein